MAYHTNTCELHKLSDCLLKVYTARKKSFKEYNENKTNK